MNFTHQEQDYYELIIDMLDDGTIEESERALLNKRKSKYGISDERAKEIEDFALQEMQNKNKPKFNTEGEKEYYELLEDMLDNGTIDENGRKLLNKRKIKYGLSDERAKEFEDYIKDRKGISKNILDSCLILDKKTVDDAIFNSSNEENINDLFEQGKSYYEDGDYEESIKCLSKAVELNPENASNWHWLGTSYNQNCNYEEAIRCLKRVVELEPNDADNWYSLANFYLSNGDEDEAMYAYNKAIEINPKKRDLFSIIIKSSSSINSTIEDNLYLLKKTLKNDLYLLNKALENEYRDSKLKNITSMAFYIIKWLIDNPIYNEDRNYYNYHIEFFVLSENIIGYLFGFERYSDVIYLKRKLFNIIIHSENNYIDDVYISIMSGRASLCLENYDKAIRKFYYLMRHYELDDERLASVWFYLGYCHCELGYLEESKNDYKNAIELDDNDSMYWNNYGVTLSRMGYAADAREAYQKALEIDPDNELAMNNLNSLRYNNSGSGGFISDIISGISDLFK